MEPVQLGGSGRVGEGCLVLAARSAAVTREEQAMLVRLRESGNFIAVSVASPP